MAMWRADPPTYTVEQAAEACVRRIRDKELGRRLTNAVPTLRGHSDAYHAAATNGSVHTLTPKAFAVPRVSDKEMVWFYDRRMAAQGRPGRVIYQALLDGAVLDRCPYCNYGRPKTLDHVAGKEHFAGLAINPWNLVPCCGDCNHTKGSTLPASAQHEPLHPYFMPPLDRWLRATIVPGSPPVAAYRVEPAATMPGDVVDRVRNHFELFKLAELYASVSSGIIVENVSHARRLFGAGGTDLLRAHLREMETDIAEDTDPNNWKAVLYGALADSDWYCGGGFNE